MKKIFKIFGILVLIILAALYVYFLKFLPEAIDLNAYIPQIKALVRENSNLELNIGNLELKTTPLLGIGVDVSDISVNLPDNSTLFSAPLLKTRVSLPNLLILDVRISDISLYKPVVNLEIANGKEFKVVKTIEGLLLENEKKQAPSAAKQEGFNPLNLIRINAPSLNIYDYRAYISDIASGEYLLLRGDKTKIGYYNGKRAKVKAGAELFLNKEKQVDINIDINSFIPEKGELDEEDDPAVRTEVPFINPVLTYKNYDPRGEVCAKIKLNKNGTRGFFGLENLTMDINGYKIPKSYIRAKFAGKKIFTESDIYVAADRHLKISGNIKQSKTPDFDLNIFSNGVYFNDLILLSKGILDSAGVKNNLADIKGEGFFSADLAAKTNSRHLKSQGKFEIKNGAIVNSRAGLGLKQINALVLFDDNSLEIKNAGLKVNEGVLKIEGKINEKADTDISVSAEKLPLPALFRAFAPDNIKKEFNLSKGALSLDTKIKGRMKNAVITFDTRVDDLRISDRLNKMIITNKAFKFDADNAEKLAGKLSNSGFEFSLPYAKSSVANALIELSFDDKNLVLNPTQFKVNKNSALTFSGKIEDYMKRPFFDFTADGNLYANELKAFLGAQAEPFVDAKGLIPLKASFRGDLKKQTLEAQIAADRENFITPVHIKAIQNNQTIARLLVDFKGNRIKIKNSGLYSKLVPSDFGDDFEQNMADCAPVASIEGTIMDVDTNSPVINMLKLNIPKPLEISLAGFKDSYAALAGRLSVIGNPQSPRYKGRFVLSNVKIPDASLDMKQARLSLNGKDAEFSTENLVVNGSDLQISTGINLETIPLISLNNLKFNSENLDVDKLMEVSNHVLSMIPENPAPTEQADIPAVINSGTFNINSAKTGNLNVRRLLGNIRLAQNILFVDNLSGDIFDGNFGGNLNVNLLNYLVNADISGKNMDADIALVTLANLKDTLTGKLSFDTKISLQGLNFEEQVKSLDGTFNFLIENGQAGPFSKIENIFLSENLRESEFFQSAIGSVISSAVSVDTSRFQELKGTINFKKDGIAYIEPVTMQGNALCIKVAGDMDILQNTLDASVRGRLGSAVASALGPLANVNPINIVKATPGLNVVMAKTFSVFCEKVSQAEMDSIPDFSKDRSEFNATKFQIVLRGDVAKPLGLLKSFKWLVTDDEYEMAENFVSSIPDELPEGVNTLEEMQVYQAEVAAEEAEAKTLKGKIKNLFRKKETI